jgi:hypothetical protein
MIGLSPPVLAVLTFVFGAVVGALYLRLLARSVSALEGGASLRRVSAFALLRLVMAGSLFWAAALQGAATLLLILAGFVTARLVLLHRIAGSLQ